MSAGCSGLGADDSACDGQDAAEAVATLRLDAGRYPDDPATRQLVG